MKKLYCIIWGKYRKFEKCKISYLLEKTLILSIICSKCKNEDEKIFNEDKSIEILKILGSIENILKIWVKNLDFKKRWNKIFFSWRNKAEWIE